MLRRSKKQKHLSDGTPILPLPDKHMRMLRGARISCFDGYQTFRCRYMTTNKHVYTVRWRNDPDKKYKNTSHNEAYIYKYVEIFVMKSEW